MFSNRRVNWYLATFLSFIFCLAIGCSEKKTDDKNNKSNNSNVKDDDSDSKKTNESGSSGKKSDEGDGVKDSGPAEPIVANKFPRPANAEKPMYTSETNTVMFHQEGTVEDQASFYSEELKKLGWSKNDSSEVADGVAFLDFEKGSLSITVTINPLRDGMITTIGQGSGISVPEALEQDDED